MREVIYPKPDSEKQNTEERCPNCKSEMRKGQIPCPDGMAGCCVYHVGLTCLGCGKIYQ